MRLDKLTKDLLDKIANLHNLPNGAVSFRKNGKTEVLNSTKNIEINKKADNSGIDIIIHSNCKNEVCHMPVVVTENGYFDQVSNDFFIEPDASVTIVAGCGVHSSEDAGHDGVHTFHVGSSAKVKYIENHFAQGKGSKQLSPTTVIVLEDGAEMEIETIQYGGVDFANRKTRAKLKKNSTLIVNERLITERFDVAKSDFSVALDGENSKCKIVSRSVASGESEQEFKSNLVGKNSCFGHVECDSIVLDDAVVVSSPKVTAKNKLASLSHEAAIGKIAADQVVKLMTLGLTEKEAEQKIIEGFLK